MVNGDIETLSKLIIVKKMNLLLGYTGGIAYI